jgi:hypothetical protein
MKILQDINHWPIEGRESLLKKQQQKTEVKNSIRFLFLFIGMKINTVQCTYLTQSNDLFPNVQVWEAGSNKILSSSCQLHHFPDIS